MLCLRTCAGAAGIQKVWPTARLRRVCCLRPAIPSEEIFDADGTYGPKANFKISVRELPDHGRFRVTVVAAKYRDGLLLDPGAKEQAGGEGAVVIADPKTPGTVTIPKAGIYQVDLAVEKASTAPADVSHLKDGLSGAWPKDGDAGGHLDGKAKIADSPVGKAVFVSGAGGLVVPRKVLPTDDAANVGEGDFSVAAWIHPGKLKREGIVSLGNSDRTHGLVSGHAGG